MLKSEHKKKILVMPDGNWLAHVSRPYEIAKVLRAMGHDVLFAGEGKYMDLPRASGFKIHPIKTTDPGRTLACVRSGRADWHDYATLKECVEEELKLFRKVGPDMVLGDFRLSLSTSCESARIPLAVVLNAAWTNYYSISPTAPEHFPLTRIFGKRIVTWLAPWIKSLIINVDGRPYSRLRREMGLGSRGNLWDIWAGDLNLLADIPEYGPTENLPSHFHYIGPLVWEPEMKAPDWLNGLDPARPTIYFTMGSTGHARFFEQAIQLFGNSRYQCIMTTAGMAKLSSVPKNFFVTDFAPGSALMEKSDLVVCQGGNGTIYQALSRGVPIIGIPTMHDQEFNLNRVVDLGFGIQLSDLKFKPDHLVEAVERLMTRKHYRENAQRYRKILAGYNGPKKGAELIHAY